MEMVFTLRYSMEGRRRVRPPFRFLSRALFFEEISMFQRNEDPTR